MAAHTPLKNEFTEDEKNHNLMRWLKYILQNGTTISEMVQESAPYNTTGSDNYCCPEFYYIIIGYLLSIKQAILPSISKTTTHITMK